MVTLSNLSIVFLWSFFFFLLCFEFFLSLSFFFLFLTAFAFCGRFFFGFCRREISRRDESILAGESRVQFVSVLPLYSFCYCNQKIVDHAVNAARRGWLTLLVVSNGFMIYLNISFFSFFSFFYFYHGLFCIIFCSFSFRLIFVEETCFFFFLLFNHC